MASNRTVPIDHSAADVLHQSTSLTMTRQIVIVRDYDDHHRRSTVMPMIDVYAAQGTFHDKSLLARDLARTLMEIEA